MFFSLYSFILSHGCQIHFWFSLVIFPDGALREVFIIGIFLLHPMTNLKGGFQVMEYLRHSKGISFKIFFSLSLNWDDQMDMRALDVEILTSHWHQGITTLLVRHESMTSNQCPCYTMDFDGTIEVQHQ